MKIRIYIAFFCVFSIALFENFRFYSSQNEEYEVKAAFIYNFTKYIDWEDESMLNSSTFVIAVYKESPLEKELLKLLNAKKVKNKKIEILQIFDPSEIPKAHIVFLPEKTISKDFKRFLQNENLKSSLIISEKQGRLELGSGINFVTISKNIKFEINLNSTKKNKLKVSSQLLKLAEKIKQ